MAVDTDTEVQDAPQQQNPAQPPPDATPAPAAQAPAASAQPEQPDVQHVQPGQQADQIPLEQMKADSWGTKVYHGILNALGGSNDITMARDPQTGKMVATAVKSGPGQQWKRIISGAITGAGASMAGGGTGPGSTARKFGLGIQAGTQQAQKGQQQQRDQANEDFEAQQKAATSNAQNALLSHQIAESTFRLGRSQVDATEADSDRETNFTKMIADGGEGSQDMGVYPDFPSVIKAFKEMPELHNHQAGGRMVTIPHIDGNGKVDGVHVALVTPDWLSSKMGKDLPISVKSVKDGKLQEETFTIPAGSITNDQASKLLMGQSKDAVDEHTKAEDQKREAGRAAAQNAESYAAAGKDKAEQHKAEADAAWTSTDEAAAGAGGAGGTLVDMIGRGQMPIGRMNYLMAKKPEILAAVAARYPGFDGSKIEAYVSATKDFTSTKPNSAGGALNAGGTVLTHLQNLARLNTLESHIPHTPDWIAYHNQLETLVPELGKFYGNDTIPGLQGYRDTLGSTLPKNRMTAIQTQAHSMGQKFDSYVQSWKNAAPSPVYEAHMPGISQGAVAALSALDPEYPKSTLAELQGLRQVLSVSGAAAGRTPSAGAPPAQGPGAGKSISLADAMNLPQFKGQTPAQVRSAAEALHYTVTQ